jgi:TPR repeat protein
MRVLLILLLVLLPGAVRAQPAYDPARFSQSVTDCDRLAAHPDDPFKVSPGVPQAQVNFAVAIPACEAAVKADPANPRLAYQLARIYGYSGQGEKAIPFRQQATAALYPQSLFVVGFITLFGMNKQPQDTCKAGELIRQSAIAGRLAGQVAFPRYVLQGRFKDCAVPQDKAEMLGFLSAARKQVGQEFYQGMLIDLLTEQVSAR